MSDSLEHLTSALADRYTVEGELGHGGMATVYLAEDLKHRRKVAIKVLRPELSATIGVERFLREIEIAAKLVHPHILPLLDSGKAVGRYGGRAVGDQGELLFYVMPYVEGESLRDRLLRERQLPIDDALTLTREVASALSYAHEQGVIHRDIKPENIMLSAGGAVVADFGIARAVTAAGGETLTETGMAVGTPAYMSPEQASGERDIDARSDIYSLGCVLYEMLAGEAPYLASTPQALIAKKLSEPIPRISVVRETVPEGLEQVVLKSLARTPADRFSTAADFRAALEPKSLELATTRPALTQLGAHWRWIVAAIATAAIAAIATVLGVRGAGAGTSLRYASLAALPVVNLTGDTTWDAQTVGLTHELITRLGILGGDGGLSQRSLRSVLMASEGAVSPLQIAERLGVEALLETNLVATAGSVHMSVAIVDGHSGAQVWAASFTELFPNVRTVFDEITMSVADQMGV